MEDIYGFYTTSSGSTGGQGQYYYAEDKPLMSPAPENLVLPPSEYQTLFYSTGAGSGSHHYHNQQQRMVPSYDVVYGGSEIELPTVISEAPPEQGVGEDTVKARIKSHPSYPRLLQAYIDCQKVGAPPEISALLEEIRNENDGAWNKRSGCCFGADPELDEFMETYIDMLVKYKSDLERPFDEATTFLNKIELQLSNLSTTASFSPDEGGGLSDEEFSGGETDVAEAQVRSEDRNLKDRLLREFGSHISSLKLEFSKKKKKGKLPKEARQTLLDWWNVHYKWPYPTEVDKNTLAQSTGLDQKQINNWFINQRKRHWKPSENMQLALMDNLPGQFFTDD